MDLQVLKKMFYESKDSLKGMSPLEAVKENGHSLAYVFNQTEEICLAAVKQNGMALQYVHNQTPKICLAAVKQNGYALQHVHNQTPEICIAAIKQNKNAIKYINPIIFDSLPKEKMISIDGKEIPESTIKIVLKEYFK